jgi:hypothetical protein
VPPDETDAGAVAVAGDVMIGSRLVSSDAVLEGLPVAAHTWGHGFGAILVLGAVLLMTGTIAFIAVLSDNWAPIVMISGGAILWVIFHSVSMLVVLVVVFFILGFMAGNP